MNALLWCKPNKIFSVLKFFLTDCLFLVQKFIVCCFNRANWISNCQTLLLINIGTTALTTGPTNTYWFSQTETNNGTTSNPQYVLKVFHSVDGWATSLYTSIQSLYTYTAVTNDILVYEVCSHISYIIIPRATELL